MKRIAFVVVFIFDLSACQTNTPAPMPTKAPIPTILPTETPTPAPTDTPTSTETLIPTSTKTPNPTSTFISTPGLGVTQVSAQDGMVMVYVPAGDFSMGNPAILFMDNGPMHVVYLDAYWIDRTEVMERMDALCVQAGTCQPPWTPGSYTCSSYYGTSQYADFPVIYMNWNDAQSYCGWVGQMLLNGGELEGIRLLGRKTVEWMLQNHLPAGVHPMGEPANGFGLGGAALLHPGLSHRPGSAGRFGWGGAANTEWWIDPVEELQCLIMLQYMPCFTIPVVEDFTGLANQVLE